MKHSHKGPTEHPLARSAALAILLVPSMCLCAQRNTKVVTAPPTADFYVAPNGNDNWSGKLPAASGDRADGPFATLSRACDAVRSLKASEKPRDITVFLRGGTYRLTETVTFSLEDAAADGQVTTYAAYPGETPVFSSGLPIQNWRKLQDAPAGLPPAASGNVWVADVSRFRERKKPADGAWRFSTLYDGPRRLPRARSEGFSPTKSTPRGKRWDRQTVHFPKGAMKNWPNLRDAELVIVPCYFWVMNILPIASVDEEAGVAKTTVPCTYPMSKNGTRDRHNAWVENVIECLDQPGEWVLDTSSERLYLWPHGDEPGDQIVAPLLRELLRIEGQIDYDGPTDTPVKGLVFRGLAFTHGDRLSWHGCSGWGLQHDWELFDRPTALVRLRGAEGCAIEDCHFSSSSHAAVRLDLHCQKNRIAGNHIEHLGGVGILLAGYGPGTKDVNRRNEVVNNYIHHIGEVYWGSAGIFAWQSGENRIAHNHIHHVPYTGIVVSGRIGWDPKGNGECSRTVRWSETGVDPKGKRRRLSWQERERFLHGRKNLVEYNDIHNAMEVLGDGNCIYISGTGTGNVVRGNYCHDCNGKYMNAVIRCDDDQHGTIIEGNVMHRTRGHGEGVISKGDNDIINNVIADLRPHHGHRGYIVFPYGSPKGSTIQRNILYSGRKGQIPYYQNRGGRRGIVPRLRDTDADYNLYHCTEDAKWTAQHLETERGFGIEAHSAAGDPRFVDADQGDFRFQPGSPAVELGIHSLDPSKAGLEPRYHEKLIGKVIRTRITPSGRELAGPLTIAIEADVRDAQIRYTLDGSEPTAHSLLYGAPFILEEGATIRARAFADGVTDLMGASVVFTAPPPSIVEDFESVELGEATPLATTQEENDQMTARVTAEQAASGRRSLKFIDGPGQKYPFNPHVYYRTRFRSGRMVGRFAIRIDKSTRLYYQWRDYGPGFKRGPTVEIREAGKLVHAGDELMSLPLAQWIRFEVSCALGDEATGRYDMKVILPDKGQPREFKGLEYEQDFRKLDWLGFVANGQAHTVFYVDDIELRPLR